MSEGRTTKSVDPGSNASVEQFLKDPSKIECVELLVKALASTNDNKTVKAIVGLNEIFSHIFSTNENFFSCDSHPLADAFSAAWESLLENLKKNTPPSDLALQTLLLWIECETVKASTKNSYVFPEARLVKLLEVLCGDFAFVKQLSHFQKKIEEYDDLNFYACKALWQISDKFSKPTTEREIHNYFSLLKAVRVSKNVTEDAVLSVFGGADTSFSFAFQELRKFYQYAWVNFLRASLPAKLYIHVLVFLDEKKVALFRNPCVLADFLIESYNKGGAVALLALNGLFTLIHKHNLELPDFYTRLYALFKPEIVYQKYRARFFFLADVFLSSSHLPAYLVAAFAKKLARLCLVAPLYSQMYLIPFIGNLIIRHAALSRMVHCQDVTDMSTDPYEENEPDPAKSRAIESSLWELKTLQSHWFQGVVAKASVINSVFPKGESDYSDVLEDGYPDYFAKAIKETYRKTVPTTNYHKPKGLLKHADDKLSQSWILE